MRRLAAIRSSPTKPIIAETGGAQSPTRRFVRRNARGANR